VSEQPDQDSKTEAPTEKRIQDAIEKGNSPFSREIVSLGSVLAMLAGMHLLITQAATGLTEQLQAGFASVEGMMFRSPEDAGHYLKQVFQASALWLLPFSLLLMAGGMIGALMQNPPSARITRVAPKWERLLPGQSMKRLFGREALIEFVKTSAKFAALLVIGWFVLQARLRDVINVGMAEVFAIPLSLRDVCIAILTSTACFVFLLAIADIVWTRIKWWDDLKMTRQEMKDEYKLSEGDPLLKQKRKSLALRRSRSRMLADVPKATLIVVNPTHFAVALRYVASEGGAPVVMAKGLDIVALKIRELSATHKIPIVENKPLARSLYGSCEVGEMIPAEYYRAVAEVIHFVERRRQLSNTSVV
jgi:flagellar biosynthesis protein FlhB